MRTSAELVREIDELTEELLSDWIEQGWVRPKRTKETLYYTDVDTARVRMICDFRVRLQIDSEATELMLKLLDQVYGLRLQLRTLSRAVSKLPEEARDQVKHALTVDILDRPDNQS